MLEVKRSLEILVLSQTYPPDPAAGGQLLADACRALAERGLSVRVLNSDRGYDDPQKRYARAEVRDGVIVRRLPFCSFGQGSAAMRLLGGLSFTVQTLLRGLFGVRPDVVLVSTFPPLAPLGALEIARVRRSALVYWIMDLNPDQAVVLKQFAPTSWPVRALNWMQRRVLSRARDVVVLDRFMAQRVRDKGAPVRRLSVVPPWPLQSSGTDVAREANPFRARHGFEDRLVVMYSGNHGPSHPLATILAAAEQLRGDPRFVFVFVGGGVGKRDVEAIAGPAIRSLPYEPLATLHESLSAADVHVVTMGDAVVGINHPSKIYDALAVGRPILFIGPSECHIADILAKNSVGWHVRHGDVAGARRVLETIAAMPPEELRAMGRRAASAARSSFAREVLRATFCDIVIPPSARETSPRRAGGEVPERMARPTS
jgi:putative colanic acid biosynthesis glycosyltransferase WcaI